MEAVQGFLKRELFRVDGMTFTVGVVVVVVLVWLVFFKK